MADYSDIQFEASQADYIARLEVLRLRAEGTQTQLDASPVNAAGLELKPHSLDLVSDYVVAGFFNTAVPSNTLILANPGGTAYIAGRRLIRAAFSTTFPTSKDNYVDVDNLGNVTTISVTNGAAAPAITGNSLRMQLVVTDATKISAITDLRALTTPRLLDTALATLRAAQSMQCDGNLSWITSNFAWTNRLLITSVGRGAHFSANGVFDIFMPAVGTPLRVLANAPARNFTASGVALSINEALFYILPIGKNGGSVAGNFVVVFYTADFIIPPHWLLLAWVSGTSSLRVGNLCVLKSGQTRVAGEGHAQTGGDAAQKFKVADGVAQNDALALGQLADVLATPGGALATGQPFYQHGTVTLSAADQTFNFPSAFPTAATLILGSNSSGTEGVRFSITSASQFVARASAGTPTATWFAIGY